jgi:hypothetical protein
MISLNKPDFQVIVSPFTAAGRSPEAIFTELPFGLITNGTLTLPHIPWLIVPNQFPANLPGPKLAGVWADALSLPVARDFGLADFFHFGFDACSGAGVGFSGASTIGAGRRWTLDSSKRATSTMRQAALTPCDLRRRVILRDEENLVRVRILYLGA